MQKPYKYFFKKSAILLILLVAIDIIGGNLIEHYYYKMKSGQSSRITYALTKSNEDIIIFGSSRANHHYVPSIFEDSLHLKCYNAGIDAQSILYHYAILKNRLLRSSPKIIILDVNISDLEKSEDSYTRLYALLPYYKNNKEVQPIINLRSKYEPIKTASNLYRYNSFILPVLINNLVDRVDNAQQGYIPLHKTLTKELSEISIDNKSKELDSIKVNTLISFLQETRKRDCKVFVCISPFYKKGDISQMVKKLSDICSQQNVPFFNYSESSSFYNKKELFEDIQHLNNKGAEMYSKAISSEIAKHLKPL